MSRLCGTRACEVLDEYRGYLAAKGDTSRHVEELARCCRAVLRAIGAKQLAEIRAGPRLAMNVYTDPMLLDMKGAVDRLSRFRNGSRAARSVEG